MAEEDAEVGLCPASRLYCNEQETDNGGYSCSGRKCLKTNIWKIKERNVALAYLEIYWTYSPP